jgi:hypothetical protein
MRDEFTEDLKAALGTRPVIEQAKGVLIGLRGSTPDQAFAELRHASQTHNVKLSALAAALVDAASGIPSADAALQEVLLGEWGRLLVRYPAAVEEVDEQASA